jgi:hypothetical protein
LRDEFGFSDEFNRFINGREQFCDEMNTRGTNGSEIYFIGVQKIEKYPQKCTNIKD